MSEKNSLENLLERHKIYSGAGALGKDLQSKEINHRDNARNFLRDYHEGKNDIELPTDQPMSNEFYDWTVLGIQAESGRDNYWNVEKENCISRLSSKILEENVSGIMPVKLEKGQGKYAKHNGALDLHMESCALNSICEKYDNGEIGKEELKGIAGSEIKKSISKRLEEDNYLTDKEKGLVLRSAISTLTVGDVARKITGRIAEKKEKEFREYFADSKDYSASEYAKENLIYQSDINSAIGKVVDLYREDLQE